MQNKPSLGLSFNKVSNLPNIRKDNPFFVDKNDEKMFIEYEGVTRIPLETKHSLTAQNKPNREGVLRRIKDIPAVEEKLKEKAATIAGDQLAIPVHAEVMYMKAIEDGSWPENMPLMKNEDRSEESSQEPQEDIQKKLLYLNQGKRESFKEYVENIKKVFLAQKSIIDKREEIKRMTEFINDKECVLKDSEKCFTKTKNNFNRFIQEITKAASDGVVNAAEKAKILQQEQEKYDKLKHEEFLVEKQIEKNLEKLKELIAHKEFLDDFNKEHSERHNKMRLERIEERKRTGKIILERAENNDAQGSTFMTQDKTLNPQKKREETKVDVFLSETNRKKLKEVQITEYDSDTEYDIGFNDPNELIEKIHILEKENIESIETAQNLEKEYEAIKKAEVDEKNKLDKIIKNHKLTQSELIKNAETKEVLVNILEKKDVLPVDADTKKEEENKDRLIIVTVDNKKNIYEAIKSICESRKLINKQNPTLIEMLKDLEHFVKEKVTKYKEDISEPTKRRTIEEKMKEVREYRSKEKIDKKKKDDMASNDEKKRIQKLHAEQVRKVYNHKDRVDRMMPLKKAEANNENNMQKNIDDEERKYFLE